MKKQNKDGETNYYLINKEKNSSRPLQYKTSLKKRMGYSVKYTISAIHK